MNSDLLTEETGRFCKVAKTLLIEYSKKLDHMRDEARSIRDRHRGASDKMEKNVLEDQFHAITMRSHSLSAALHDLARSVSQRLEHGDLEDADRVELRLRLADLESNIHLTTHVISRSGI